MYINLLHAHNTFWPNITIKTFYMQLSDIPSADIGVVSLVQTCTVKGASDGVDEMRVNAIKPSDSAALLAFRRNSTTTVSIINNAASA